MYAASSIEFKKIESGTIFDHDFRNFLRNNSITFSEQGLAVIYGPNGTGKTSFINVLNGKQGTSFSAEYLGTTFTDNTNGLFYIISDQNHRNIISGTAQDFFIAENIQREFDLAAEIAKARERFITSLIEQSKSIYKLTSASSKALDIITSSGLKLLLIDCLNSRNKGKNYDANKIISVVNELSSEIIPDFDQSKWAFFVEDIAETTSLVKIVLSLPLEKVMVNPQVHEIEENTEALRVLERFPDKTQCVVCDNQGINCHSLHDKKTENRSNVLSSLDQDIREVVLTVINNTRINDPFDIKGHLVSALDSGDISKIVSLQREFSSYTALYNTRLINSIKNLLAADSITASLEEYNQLIRERPEISEEDMMYVEEIISNSMGKELRVTRDSNKTIKLQLSNADFLGLDRDSLPLSTGEQNFLSLTFEFLKAKNSNCSIVVLDDPISSFDSIYKNKIAFAIVKILSEKKRIILTHNIDLLRLLDSQHGNCYNLYILNNTTGENNGFIALNQSEKDMVINLKSLLDTFRLKIFPYIKDSTSFLISMIPFCRGYATLIGDKESVDALTNVMHGYKSEQVDVASIYRNVFKISNAAIPESYTIRVDDILHKSVEMIDIVDPKEFPLLNRTLKHSFTYLQLRLLVEKALVERFGFEVKPNMQLGQIINAAFPNNDVESIKYRIRLTSKKTLINEFNHFEGNMSIFQPAIDITNASLNTEKAAILSFVEAINSRMI